MSFVPASSPHPSKTLVESSYDLIAPRYLSWVSETPSPREANVAKLLTLLSSSSSITSPRPKILELGCGAGIPVTLLLSKDADVTANDISAVQLELAAKHVPSPPASVEFVKSDMMGLEFEEGSFDAVVACYSIIHLPREEQKELMKRACDWVKRGGYLLCNLGTRDDRESFKEDWLGGKMWWSGWDVEGNLGMVREAGWKVVENEVLEQEERMKRQDGRVESRMVPFLWVVGRKGGDREVDRADKEEESDGE